MSDQITIHGAQGSGSVAAEAAMTLLGVPYRLVDIAMDSADQFLEEAAKVNPMKQVPALILPGGQLMTESAAILIWLADTHGQLAPKPDDPRRAEFLRWMVYVPAAIYSLYWIRDVPSRLAADADAEAVVLERTLDRIADCWRIMDQQVQPGRYILGDEMTVLDLYVTVVSRWSPRRRRFHEVAPKMAEVVRRVDSDPRLADFWTERFPFVEGWEG